MNHAIDIYQSATKTFIQKFDIYWNDMLKILDSHQSQLIVGNRLRPQIALWGYLATVAPDKVISHDFDQISNIAVSIEMIHKASLLLDDWIDNDEERHGKLAFHAEYDPQYAVIFSLNMLGLAMHRLEGAFPSSVVLPHHYSLCLDTLVKTIYSMAKGALEELRLQKNDFLDSTKIREITQLETSEIIGNSMLLGYYVGAGQNKDSRVEVIFKKLGDQCGYLFQALNDLEAFGNPQQLAVHKGSLNMDLFANRKNLAISALYEISSKSDRLLLQHINEVDLLRLMKKYKVVESLKDELATVYMDILSTGKQLHSIGLSAEWCEGLQWFLERIKKYAEERLKE